MSGIEIRFAVGMVILFSAVGFIIMLLFRITDLIMEVMIKLDLIRKEVKNVLHNS